MKRWLTWAGVTLLVLEIGGALAAWTYRPLAQSMYDWLWTNVAPVLDRLTGLK